MLGTVSLTVGLIFGFLTSFVFKHAVFLRGNAITETFLMFIFSILSYFVSNSIIIGGIEMSGIISLLTCGIIQSHYTYYNMSPQGKTCATLTVSFLGTAAEAAVYSYIGIGLYSLIATWWSFAFIGAQILIIVAGRCVAVLFVFYAGRLCCRKKTINFNELCFITYAGQIRGAIAFALVLKIPIAGEPGCEVNPTTGTNSCVSEENYEVLVSSTLILVMVTTLVFGTFMAQVGKRLVPPTEEQAEEFNREVRSTSVIIAKELSRRNTSIANESHYDLIQHPNEDQ